MTRVLIRASPVVRAGLESLLSGQQRIEVIEEEIPSELDVGGLRRDRQFGGDGGIELSEDVHAAAPDVILAEAEEWAGESAPNAFGESEWVEAAEESGAPVVVLVRGPSPAGGASEWISALRHGVRGILPANASREQIVAAIEAAAAGLAVFDPAELPGLWDGALPNRPAEADSLAEPLTPRETEVLRAMAEGLANKEIAARLGISEHTVKFHVGSVMGKLGAASRTEAVTMGIRRGIVLI